MVAGVVYGRTWWFSRFAKQDEWRVQKATQQALQGQWMAWEGAPQKVPDLWRRVEGGHLLLSFADRSMYDLLPSAATLVKWGNTDDDACPPCSKRRLVYWVFMV